MNIEEMKKDYAWKEAFGFSTFGIDEVMTIIGADTGQNDESDWICYGQLKDGQYFFLSAWCDYTGWDCRSGGNCWESDSLDDLIRMHMTDEARERFGLKI